MPSKKCLRCNRELKDELSIAIGFGDVCWQKVRTTTMNGNFDSDNNYTDVHLMDDPILLIEEVKLLRTNSIWGDDTVYTNVPHLFWHHSPTGFEWGYGGSGPADLALNLVELILRKIGYDATKNEMTELASGDKCFGASYRMHQDFKWEFIAGADKHDAVIQLSLMETWVKDKLKIGTQLPLPLGVNTNEKS